VFLRLGRTEAYLCAEPTGTWAFERGPDGLEVQAWRLHLIVGPVPVG
jgi:hypothetical protein